MRLRPPDRRRSLGATYTPAEIVSAMVGWAAGRVPDRVVDPGTGSARFLTAAGRALPEASLVGVEIDPLAALLARANLTAAGFDDRSRVVVHDYRTADLGEGTGATAYLGNPPYVRHHQIAPSDKAWLARRAADLGLKASGLAGLHVHFLLATAMHARPGDVGAFVTSAEWLEVNYGRLPRELVAGELGGVSIHVIDPEAVPFDGTATTAAVTCFEVGTVTPAIRIKRVKTPSGLGALEGGQRFSRERLRIAPRWSSLLNGAPKPPEDWVELGELCRVHRGAVTGANSTWITDANDLERARIAQGFGFQRLRWLMSLAVRMQAMARASWARRWWGRRSVLRRSCPKFDSRELVRSMLQRWPRGTGRGPAAPGGRLWGQATSAMPASARRRRAVALS